MDVNIQIQCCQVVKYITTVTMPVDMWEQIKNTPVCDMLNESTSPLTDILDNDDIHEWYDFSDVEMVVVDKDEPVDGEECYSAVEK